MRENCMLSAPESMHKIRPFCCNCWNVQDCLDPLTPKKNMRKLWKLWVILALYSPRSWKLRVLVELKLPYSAESSTPSSSAHVARIASIQTLRWVPSFANRLRELYLTAWLSIETRKLEIIMYLVNLCLSCSRLLQLCCAGVDYVNVL